MDTILLGVLLVIAAGAVLVMANQRHLLLVGLLLHYLAVFLLVQPSLGWNISLVKPIAGVIAVGILIFSLRGMEAAKSPGVSDLIDRPLVRATVLLLTLTAGWGIGRTAWLQIPSLSVEVQIGATMLLTLGLLMAAFFDEPIRAGPGIMACLSGFEVVYASLEPSLAILALLAGVQISLSLVVGFLSQMDTSAKAPST